MSDAHEAPAAGGDRYLSPSSRTLLQIVEALAPLTIQGAPVKALMRKSGASRDQVFRSLKNLEAGGWAEQQGDVWRLTPRITLISAGVERSISDAARRWLDPR